MQGGTGRRNDIIRKAMNRMAMVVLVGMCAGGHTSCTRPESAVNTTVDAKETLGEGDAPRTATERLWSIAERRC